jgi:hypothetical protein
MHIHEYKYKDIQKEKEHHATHNDVYISYSYTYYE